MAKNVNQSKQYRIYLKSTKEWVEVPEEFYREQTRYYDTFRHRMQEHGQCSCPKSKFWLCDGDCLTCEFRCAGDMLSLDYETENDSGDTCSMLDSIPDTAPLAADIIADKLLLEQLVQRLHELDPDAGLILQLLKDEKSDRAIAESLGRPQRTFAHQMKRYRDELRNIRGY